MMDRLTHVRNIFLEGQKEEKQHSVTKKFEGTYRNPSIRDMNPVIERRAWGGGSELLGAPFFAQWSVFGSE